MQEARRELWKSAAGLTEAQLDARIGEGWSVLGNLEHLYAMEMFVAEALHGVLQAPAGAAVPPKVLAGLLDRSVKYNAPPSGHPSGRLGSVEEARQRLGESLAQLETVFSSVPAARQDSGCSMAHPVFGVRSVEQWKASGPAYARPYGPD